MGCVVGKEKDVAHAGQPNERNDRQRKERNENGEAPKEDRRPNPLAQAPKQPDADEPPKPPNAASQLMAFYEAGTYPAGDPTVGVPMKGPYASERVPPQTALAGRTLFASYEQLPRVVPQSSQLLSQMSAGPPELAATGSWFCRAYFPHTLAGYSCGWARVDINPRAPHFNLRKHAKDDLEKIENGLPLDLSKRKKWHLYTEAVNAIGLFVTVNGETYDTGAAASPNTWGCAPIPGAFFTFVPDTGSILGENSLPITLRVAMQENENDVEGDQMAAMRAEGRRDARWTRMSYEMNRVLISTAQAMLATPPSTFKVTIRVGVRFRYNNQKFTAWSEREAAKGNFRFVDDKREAVAVSAEVASGSMVVDLSNGETDAEAALKAVETTMKSLAAEQGVLEGLGAHKNTEDIP